MTKFYKRRYRAIKYGSLVIVIVAEFLLTMCYLDSSIPASRYWIATAIMMFTLVCILGLLSGNSMDLIKQFCEQNGYSMTQLEEEFQRAGKVSANIRKGRNLIFAINEDGRPDIVALHTVDHMEFHMEWRGRSRKGIAYIYQCDGTVKKIPCAKNNFKKLSN